LELPTDRPRPPVKTYGAGAAIANLDAVQFEPVKKAAARSGTTVFVSALTAYGLLLQRLTGQSDIVIGCAAAGQSSVEDRSLVGHCVSLLPIRLQFDPERAIGETIAHVRRQVLDAFDHDRYTYGQLLGKLPLKRDPSRLPLLSTVITYEVESPEIAFDDLTVGFEPRPRKYCNFDIELHIRQSRDGLLVWLYFNEALFDQSTIERWAEYYLQLLQHLGHEPNQPSGTLPMRPDAEFVTAAGLSGAGQSPRPGGNAYDSIAAPMARARHELAVSDSDGKLTYSALDQKAGRLVALAEFFRRGAASFRRTDALLRGDGAPMLRCLAARVRLLWARALKQAGAVHDEDSGNRMHSRSLHGTLRRRHALLLPYG
jgi:non-ribosomal peptide synthetase component F